MTAKEVMDILKKNGRTLNRITGSHHVFDKTGRRPITVSYHGNKDLGRFAKDILKEAGIQ